MLAIRVANGEMWALLADHAWLDQLHTSGSLQYPDRAMYPLLCWHVIVRGWVLMVGLLLAMFVWLAGEMAGAWKVFGSDQSKAFLRPTSRVRDR